MKVSDAKALIHGDASFENNPQESDGSNPIDALSLDLLVEAFEALDRQGAREFVGADTSTRFFLFVLFKKLTANVHTGPDLSEQSVAERVLRALALASGKDNFHTVTSRLRVLLIRVAKTIGFQVSKERVRLSLSDLNLEIGELERLCAGRVDEWRIAVSESAGPRIQ